MPSRIVTSTYRYKRPPRKRKAVPLEVPAIVTKRAPRHQASAPKPASPACCMIACSATARSASASRAGSSHLCPHQLCTRLASALAVLGTEAAL